MIARIFIGVGLFALGYFLGKEIGRAESIRDQLRKAADEDRTPMELGPGSQFDPRVNPRQRPAAD